MPLYTIPAVIEVSARDQQQAESFVSHALDNAKKAELIFTLQSELVTIRRDDDECQHCGKVSDDGLTKVCVEPAEPRDMGFPGCDAVLEDWCAACVESVKHHGIVRDEEPEPDPDRERD